MLSCGCLWSLRGRARGFGGTDDERDVADAADFDNDGDACVDTDDADHHDDDGFDVVAC